MKERSPRPPQGAGNHAAWDRQPPSMLTSVASWRASSIMSSCRRANVSKHPGSNRRMRWAWRCLLYTSDAADDM
eukprot:4680152-Prorocentrum_lima.AAC.1